MIVLTTPPPPLVVDALEKPLRALLIGAPLLAVIVLAVAYPFFLPGLSAVVSAVFSFSAISWFVSTLCCAFCGFN